MPEAYANRKRARHVGAAVDSAEGLWGGSGRESAGVAVMKPTHLGECDHIAHLGRLHPTRIGAVVVQRPGLRFGHDLLSPVAVNLSGQVDDSSMRYSPLSAVMG
jgi:hypothetical protein